jgi:hypothetical protein
MNRPKPMPPMTAARRLVLVPGPISKMMMATAMASPP